MKTEIFPVTTLGGAERMPRRGSATRPLVPQKRPLLLLSEDEVFCWNLLMAATHGRRKLVRGHPAADGSQMLRIVKPEAVLLDLDVPREAAWIAADTLLQVEDCPPLILLTAHVTQSDFDTAIQAGFLIEKAIHPPKLLELVEKKLQSARAVQREQNALQRIVIRWLKPCSWSAGVPPLKRFWGINE
jgi:CheY-like chemotaxis protein